MTRNFFSLPGPALGLVLLAMVMTVAGCNRHLDMIPDAPDADDIPPTDPHRMAMFYQLSLDQAESLLKNNRELFVFDLRAPAEFAAGHLPRAVNLPATSETFLEVIEPLDRQTKVLVYGEDPVAAMVGVQKLRDAGFLLVHWPSDGYAAWVEAGKTVVTREGKSAAAGSPAGDKSPPP